MSIVATYSNIYYIVILAWSLVFLYDSFSSELPWSSCQNYWNTDPCNDTAQAVKEYWTNRILGKTSGLEEMGEFQLHLFVALMVAWFLVFVCICRGIHTSGKVVYVTALMPYFMMLVLFVRGVTLPGALQGNHVLHLP